jgi:SAM-dependent methyltransferase
MVTKLFARRAPKPADLLMDPGCGTGPFIEGVLRYCEARGIEPPQILGIELDPKHLDIARAKFRGKKNVRLVQRDYLTADLGPADFVLGNPPYVPITDLGADEKESYRARFETAVGRFDLYILFFEQSIRNLKPGGRLCFITPEKFEYVATAAPLRALLASTTIRELHHADEETFPGLVTYPTITTLAKRAAPRDTRTRVIGRDGAERDVELPRDGSSWNGSLNGAREFVNHIPLEEIAVRISCGVATGADDIFVMPSSDLPRSLAKFARPTISGRQLALMNGELTPKEVMLLPYDAQGRLLPENRLGDLRTHLSRPDNMRALKARTCVTEGKKDWYAFHDNLPLDDMLQAKILCKDIAAPPKFWADRDGAIIPRHSLYYIVPKPGVDFERLLDYLGSEPASDWLRAHCHKAANGYLRLQSNVLRQLPVPRTLLPKQKRAAQLPLIQ